MIESEIRVRLKDAEMELRQLSIDLSQVLAPKNQNSSYYKEAILANMSKAVREVFSALDNLKFYHNADDKEFKMSEK